ncbi:hypothetical protein DICPUDRAFT_155398 [Dictyostelium purpureum]|uniref:PH domain-containing protein n=1 Tax=Dictyostelium purpureum TaxID=5786 RepID=F0ZTW5_DICPU|nr:uncharacterized protein DICPUDRAFT_155398 [Dictyostelium purpureum]EGC32613.1 hypothetical protein DICPUDRAFT_155398 [Dictyostelium purpureum]|eukprot:XP_003290865.1 hypothetical protein DICPUDRAFT_155398 [Dictyostelium purpureum]
MEIKYSGYLFKYTQKGLIKYYKKRYFIISEYDDIIYYYDSADQKKLCGSIKIKDILDFNISNDKNFNSNSVWGFEITTPGRVYYFYSNKEEDRIYWIEAISNRSSNLKLLNLEDKLKNNKGYDTFIENKFDTPPTPTSLLTLPPLSSPLSTLNSLSNSDSSPLIHLELNNKTNLKLIKLLKQFNQIKKNENNIKQIYFYEKNNLDKVIGVFDEFQIKINSLNLKLINLNSNVIFQNNNIKESIESIDNKITNSFENYLMCNNNEGEDEILIYIKNQMEELNNKTNVIIEQYNKRLIDLNSNYSCFKEIEKQHNKSLIDTLKSFHNHVYLINNREIISNSLENVSILLESFLKNLIHYYNLHLGFYNNHYINNFIYYFNKNKNKFQDSGIKKNREIKFCINNSKNDNNSEIENNNSLEDNAIIDDIVDNFKNNKKLLVPSNFKSVTFSLDVNLEDNIDILYKKVSERCEKKLFQFNLIYAGDLLSKGTIGQFGIKKECTIHMILIKELVVEISYKEKLFPISIPNNDGLKVLHLIKNIREEIGIEYSEVKTSKIVLCKHGIDLNESMALQEKVSMNDVLDMKLIETDTSSSSFSTTTSTAVEDSINESELLKSFVESSISSDVEIVFCFDTTGSMASVIESVKSKVNQTVTRLMQTIPNIKIGIMGLGDYCDRENVITTLDLTENVEKLTTFITKIPHTSGGDVPEAYEYALYKAKELSWSKHTSKAFVMIGDSNPHEPSFTNLHINWFEECDNLFDMGIKIYGIQAIKECCFYQEIAERTGGLCIKFNKFDLITEMFLAICYREANKEKFKDYEKELKSNGQHGNDLKEILNDLNKENFIVIEENKESVEKENINEILNNNNNNNESSSSTKPVLKEIIKQRGKPTTIKNSETWFNISMDSLNRTPTFVYKKDKGYFEKKKIEPYVYKPIKESTNNSKCNIM